MNCTRHSDRETLLACTACDRPFCFECLQQGPVGAKCRDCTRGIAPDATAKVRAKAAVKANDYDKALSAKVLVATIAAVNLVLAFRETNSSSVEAPFTGPRSASIDVVAIRDGAWWRLVTGAIAGSGLLATGLAAAASWWIGRRIAPKLSYLQFAALAAASLAGGAFALVVGRPDAYGFGVLSIPGGLGAAYAVLRRRREVGALALPQVGRMNYGFLIVMWLVFGALRSDPGALVGLIGGAVAGGAVTLLMTSLAQKFSRDRVGVLGVAFGAMLFGAAASIASSSGAVRQAPDGVPAGDRLVDVVAANRTPDGWMAVTWWEERLDDGDYQRYLLRCEPPETRDVSAAGLLPSASAPCEWLASSTALQRTTRAVVPAECTDALQVEWRLTVTGPSPSGPVDIDVVGADGCASPPATAVSEIFLEMETAESRPAAEPATEPANPGSVVVETKL